MHDAGVSGRMTPRGPVVDEHEFTFYGNPNPAYFKHGRPGIVVECSCGAVHQLEGGHTQSALIRLICNEVNIS